MSLLHGVGSGLGGSGDAGGALGSFYSHTIDQSVRLDDASGAHLTISSASPTATNRKKVTISCWLKRATLGAAVHTLFHGSGSGLLLQFGPTGADTIYLYDFSAGSGGWQIYNSSLLIRDVGAWYHFALILDSTQSTDSDRAKLYINGSLQDFSTWTVGSGASRYPTLNASFTWHTGSTQKIGSTGGSDDIAGYIAEFISIDGQSVSISDLGETKDGVWVPKDVSGLTLGDAGFYLKFDNSSDIGNDSGSNNIDFTASNLSAHDVVPDSPTNNFAVLNVLDKTIGTPTISEGNLKISSSGSGYDGTYATIAVTSGKWYAEFLYISGDNRGFFGIAREERLSYVNSGSYLGNILDTYGLDFRARAYTGTNATSSSGVQLFDQTNFDTGDIGLLCFDVDAGKLWFGRRDVSGSTTIWYDSSGNNNGDPSAGSNPTYTFTATGSTWYIGCHDYAGTELMANFGQDGSFAGQITSQGASDANGIGDFNYIESGFLALCTSNLPDPIIGPGQSSQADDNFNTVLYTGDGNDPHAITGVGFAPDFVWIKGRNTAYQHSLYDSVRGTNPNGGRLASDQNTQENKAATNLKSFDSDGFTLSTKINSNQDTKTYVSWNWKAGGSASTISVGSISTGPDVPSIASSVSANTAAGFSIVSYTGTGSNGTIGHGLTSAPEVIFIKARTRDENWLVYHKFDGGTDGRSFLNLNLTDDKFDNGASGYFQATPPTASVFYQNTSSYNVNTDTYIAYCFHSVEGYSKVGSYEGNNDAGGTFVFTGFRPAWIIIKNADQDGTNWNVFDNKRSISNVTNDAIFASQYNTEYADNSSTAIDMLSNGFKARSTYGDLNGSGKTMTYLAFAEAPFKFANAR